MGDDSTLFPLPEDQFAVISGESITSGGENGMYSGELLEFWDEILDENSGVSGNINQNNNPAVPPQPAMPAPTENSQIQVEEEFSEDFLGIQSNYSPPLESSTSWDETTTNPSLNNIQGPSSYQPPYTSPMVSESSLTTPCSSRGLPSQFQSPPQDPMQVPDPQPGPSTSRHLPAKICVFSGALPSPFQSPPPDPSQAPKPSTSGCHSIRVSVSPNMRHSPYNLVARSQQQQKQPQANKVAFNMNQQAQSNAQVGVQPQQQQPAVGGQLGMINQSICLKQEQQYVVSAAPAIQETQQGPRVQPACTHRTPQPHLVILPPQQQLITHEMKQQQQQHSRLTDLLNQQDQQQQLQQQQLQQNFPAVAAVGQQQQQVAAFPHHEIKQEQNEMQEQMPFAGLLVQPGFQQQQQQHLSIQQQQRQTRLEQQRQREAECAANLRSHNMKGFPPAKMIGAFPDVQEPPDGVAIPCHHENCDKKFFAKPEKEMTAKRLHDKHYRDIHQHYRCEYCVIVKREEARPVVFKGYSRYQEHAIKIDGKVPKRQVKKEN